MSCLNLTSENKRCSLFSQGELPAPLFDLSLLLALSLLFLAHDVAWRLRTPSSPLSPPAHPRFHLKRSRPTLESSKHLSVFHLFSYQTSAITWILLPLLGLANNPTRSIFVSDAVGPNSHRCPPPPFVSHDAFPRLPPCHSPGFFSSPSLLKKSPRRSLHTVD